MPHAEAATSLKNISRRLSHTKGFEDCLSALQNGELVSFDGVPRSACALLLSELSRHAPASILAVVPESDWVDDLYREVGNYSEAKVAEFPRCEFEEEQPVADSNFGRRIGLLKQSLSGDAPKLIATEIKSLLASCPQATTIESHSRRVRKSESLDVEAFLKWLVENNFQSTTAVELPGEFSLRGGILDVFAFDWVTPVRIELFDDEVESIREFNAQTQRSLKNLEQVEITTVSTTCPDKAHLTDFLAPDTWVVLFETDEIETGSTHDFSELEGARVEEQSADLEGVRLERIFEEGESECLLIFHF